VGENLRLVPYWERGIDPRERIEVVIDPGSAFGSGDHPTTLMALELIESAVFRALEDGPPPNMLDVGTGTGVLAIAGKLLGTGFTLGLDIDPAAIWTARRNLQLNGQCVSYRCAFEGGNRAGFLRSEVRSSIRSGGGAPPAGGNPLRESEMVSNDRTDYTVELIVSGVEAVRGRFGIVAANLAAPVLLRLFQPLAEHTGRFLILSGIADAMADEVIALFGSEDLDLMKRLQQEGWNAVWFSKACYRR